MQGGISMQDHGGVIDVEPLVTASELEAKGILRRTTAYRLARAGTIPSFWTGPARTGVRFRVSEVLAALRRPVCDGLNTP
jgi:hypothetical protein